MKTLSTIVPSEDLPTFLLGLNGVIDSGSSDSSSLSPVERIVQLSRTVAHSATTKSFGISP